MTELEQRARELYDAGGGRASAPGWDQLGEITKSVWIERVAAELAPTSDIINHQQKDA